MAAVKPKESNCRHCGDAYMALSPQSKYCKNCSDSVNWNSRILRYGIGKKEWAKMYAEVGGICPICRVKEVTDVEHNHSTGKVRGLVCTQCNKGLGFLEQTEWVKRAQDYLRKEQS